MHVFSYHRDLDYLTVHSMPKRYTAEQAAHYILNDSDDEFEGLSEDEEEIGDVSDQEEEDALLQEDNSSSESDESDELAEATPAATLAPQLTSKDGKVWSDTPRLEPVATSSEKLLDQIVVLGSRQSPLQVLSLAFSRMKYYTLSYSVRTRRGAGFSQRIGTLLTALSYKPILDLYY